MRVIYLEARKDLFYRASRSPLSDDGSFEVFFYGTVISLRGIDYILDAAKILEERNTDVYFTFVGDEKLKRIVETAETSFRSSTSSLGNDSL